VLLFYCGCWDIFTMDCCSVMLVLPLVNSWLGAVEQGLSWFLVAFFVRGSVRQGESTTFSYCGLELGVRASLRVPKSRWFLYGLVGLLSGVKVILQGMVCSHYHALNVRCDCLRPFSFYDLGGLVIALVDWMLI